MPMLLSLTDKAILRGLLAALCLFLAWHGVGLAASPLGEFVPREPGFQVGASRSDARRLAQEKVGLGSTSEPGEPDFAPPAYCGNESVWVLEYRDWGFIFYPRCTFLRLTLEGDVVVAATGHRIFWVVI
ncbi:MAG: hypothetical protein H7124_17630 [Phycisphaerales bacterium]|nr:hypothetical protein [Hyphomonadaceae bacterium]